MTDYTGQLIGNHRMIRLLGHGSLADTYLGEHIDRKKQSAVKVLSMRLIGSNRQDFLEEVRTITSLKHPHILRVMGFGLHNAFPFLIMDYMPNGTLYQQNPLGAVLPLTTIASYVKDIAAALQYAHDAGIMHRNIKPENMFVGLDNNVLLADFRIALPSQRLLHPATLGTANAAYYMAPEQIQGNPCPASDQYALAVVVYEWMSGDRLFNGSFAELCAQHLHTPVLFDKAEFSRELEEVLQRGLAKDPEKRFGSVQSFAKAFEQAVLLELPTLPGDINALAPFDAPTISTAATVPMTALAPSKLDVPQAPILATPSNQARPSQPPAKSHHRLSRRSVLAGMAGLAVAGGTLTWLVAPRKPGIGTELYTYRGHHAFVTAVAWSPLGNYIASGSGDSTVQVWTPTNSGNILTYLGHRDVLYTVAWSPGGERLASGGADQTVQVWDATEGTSRVVVRDKPLLTYKGHANTVNAVAWSPDGKRLASASSDATVQVWSSTDGKTALTYQGHTDEVWAVAWSPDSKRAASGSFDRTIQVWNATNGDQMLIYRGHEAEVTTVVWSPDGRHIASAGLDRTVQIWDAATGLQIVTYHGHADRVYYLAWSSDGTTIASASADSTVQIWDAATGGQIFIYHGHTGYVYAVAWSSDKQRIASGGSDMTVQVWQAM